MAPQYLEIWLVNVQLGEASYPRPCIVIDLNPLNPYRILLLSTKNYSKFPSDCFKLDSTHPDFSKTGLDADSFIISDQLRLIEPNDLICKKGQLEGELAQSFEAWF